MSLTLGAHVPDGYSGVCVCVCVFVFWKLREKGFGSDLSAAPQVVAIYRNRKYCFS